MIHSLWKHRFFPLALAFLALNLFVTQDGGQNARSRLLAMRAMGDQGTLRIDPYIRQTDDWSHAPDGHYYSNKAPGSALLGLPAFFVFDKLHQVFEPGTRDERGLRNDPAYFQSTATSLVMQLIPFAVVVLLALNWLAARGFSLATQWFFALAAFFGNTASLFLNSYFGHGFEALLQLAGVIALLNGAFLWAGAAFSLSLLSDYSFAFQIPALLVLLFCRKLSFREWFRFAEGALPGAILWIWYHWQAFGGPLTIASNFQNPKFLATPAQGSHLWMGAISTPDFSVLTELLVGGSRGLILQQPWIFAGLGLGIVALAKKPMPRSGWGVLAYGFLGLAGLLFFNASFNGWEGGATAGPRYLSGVLPCLALAVALFYDRTSQAGRSLLWTTLAIGILFRAFVYGGTLLAPLVPLWPYYWEYTFFSIHRGTGLLRLFIFLLCLGLGSYYSARRMGWRLNLTRI